MATDDYQILRTAAALVDLADRAWIVVGGADRADFLQGLLTNDVAARAPGTGCYAAYLTPQGRMIADLHLLALDDRILLEVDRAMQHRLVARFDDLVFTEDVAVAGADETLAACAVHGPGAAAVVAAVCGAPAPGPEYANRPFATDAPVGPGTVARVDDLGIEGYRLLVEPGRAAALRRALVDAGAVAVAATACDVVRVESGRPRFPDDMDGDTIPLEAGIEDRAIDYHKGCYVGQEVIIRILHRGQGRVARRLVGLTLDRDDGGGASPGAGAAVHAADGDDAVGRVTSAVLSPRLGATIALAYLPRALADAVGSRVAVATGAGRVGATVTALPFVAP